MADKPQPFDPLEPEQAAEDAPRRGKRLDAIDPAKKPGDSAEGSDKFGADGSRRFTPVRGAIRPTCPGAIWSPTRCWSNGSREQLASSRLFRARCRLRPRRQCRRCGRAGSQSHRFRLVPRAAEWARKRFPDSGITFCAADLFDPPPEWRGAFDLVHETYTLQALPATILSDARKALADFLKPGGRCWSSVARATRARRSTGRPGRSPARTSRRFPSAASCWKNWKTSRRG